MPRVYAREDGVFDAIRLGDVVRMHGTDPSKLQFQFALYKSFGTDALTEWTGYDLPTDLRVGAKFGTWRPLQDHDWDHGEHGTFRPARSGSTKAVEWHRPPVVSLSISTLLSDIGGGEPRTRGSLRYRARIDSASNRWTYGVEADRLVALGQLQATRGFINVQYVKRPHQPEFVVESRMGIEQVARLGRLRTVLRAGINPDGDTTLDVRSLTWMGKRKLEKIGRRRWARG